MRGKSVLFILTSILLIDCVPKTDIPAIDTESDVKAINDLLAEHVIAVNSSNTSLNLSGFTEDVVYMPPGGPALVGKEALTDLVETFYASSKGHVDMIAEETVVSGDLAYQWGNFEGMVYPIGGGDTISMNSKFVYIYRRQADGTWKIARDIYNSNLPPGQ